jgi:hypothetical protein
MKAFIYINDMLTVWQVKRIPVPNYSMNLVKKTVIEYLQKEVGGFLYVV